MGIKNLNKLILFIIIVFAVNNNLFAQSFEQIVLDKSITVKQFILNNNITDHDFFSLNSSYSDNQSGFYSSDLDRIIPIGSIIILPAIEENDLLNSIDFIIHKTKRRQNLSIISNIYGISVETILKYNPGLPKKILKGTKIRIPRNNILSKTTPSNTVKFYKVKPREGKWRIAYKYGISISELEMINPNMGELLKIDENIVVPNKEEKDLNIIDENKGYYEVKIKQEISALEIKLGLKKNQIVKLNPNIISHDLISGMIIKVPADTRKNVELINLDSISLIENISNYNTKKIAVMLPFRTRNIDFDSIEKSKEIIKNDKLLNISLDFLFGIDMAIDNFSKYGIDVEVNVFDTGADKNVIHELFRNNDFSNYDLIIGPITNEAFNYVSKSINNSNVKIVSPLSKTDLENENIIHTIPSDNLLFEKMISYLKKDTIPSEKFIIADSYNKMISDKIKKIFPDSNQFFSRINDSGIDTRTMVYDSLDSTFVKGRNIVFLETKDQGFVSNITSILNSFVNDSTEIILTTTNKNRAFDGVNISNYYMSNLKFHYPSINRSIVENDNNEFIKKYNSRYNSYPTKYAIRGHDLVLDLLIRLSCGELDNDNLNLVESEYIENKFKYVKGINGVYKNTSAYILKFEDLKLVKIE